MNVYQVNAGELKSVLKQLSIGDKVYFPAEKRGCEVRARNERFLICTKPHFKTGMYTIIDLDIMKCGPNDRVFNPYDYCIQEDIDECLKDLSEGRVKVSQRHGIDCNFDRVKMTNPPRSEHLRRFP